MTIHRRLNVSGLGGHYTAWWLFKTMWDAGWTVPMSGSGTGGLYDTSNVYDQSQAPKYFSIRNPNGVGIGSEGFGHEACWLVLEDPSGNRQVLWQRAATASDGYDGNWEVVWSPGGRFGEGQVAGTDWDEDQRPVAPDEGVEFNAEFFEDGGSTKFNLIHVAADDTPSPAGEYGVFCLEVVNPNYPHATFMIDDLRETPVGEPHPVTVFVKGAVPYSPSNLHAYLGMDSPGTVFDYGGDLERYYTNCPYCDYYGYASLALPNNGGTGVDGKERAMPIVVLSSGLPKYLGVSRWLRTPGVNRQYPHTANSETLMFVDGVLVVDALDGLTTPATI